MINNISTRGIRGAISVKSNTEEDIKKCNNDFDFANDKPK
ncbi:MAG: chorismate mutase [Candidatus Melainabacteria bacterium]|nr:MAG: chorismate mutase [Candidatus Melainabacteria bacterium]